MRHLYVHVPFCARRCAYCDFSIAVRRVVPVDEYVAALARELPLRLEQAEASLTLDTVYLGGGTPSRLGPDGIARTLDLVRRHATVAHDAEITIEANPEDVSDDAVRAWRTAGINRVSLGVQTLDDRVLAWMHRVHSADDARRAVATIRDAGITNVSMDLIFALPESLGRDWERDVHELTALEPSHVSLYGLTVEPHTPLGRWNARGDVSESPEEQYEAQFLSAHALLGAAGFEHYEVSNYAQAGLRSRHNSAYWTGVPYLGVGPSAHSFDGQSRSWNVAPYAEWVARLTSGASPTDGSERLTEENRLAESVYLGLRTTAGLALGGAELAHVQPWIHAGWAHVGSDARLVLTPFGWLRLDSLAADLTLFRSRS